jgi:lipoate-protein ligase A
MQPTRCQYLVDPPQPGTWNMAADETMLDAAVQSGSAMLRFYQWQHPTLSLGYFQPYSQRSCHPSSQQATVVRRLSGGGALVHDRELTYSLALPASHPLIQNRDNLYVLVHQTLIDTLYDLDFHAHVQREPTETAGHIDSINASCTSIPSAEAPFLCFQRHCPGDVLMSDHHGQPVKILGSAQRRRHGTLLQHGSLLLAVSPAAPELAGIQDLTDKTPNKSDLLALWSTHLQDCLELKLIPSDWNPAQHHNIQRYQQTKYCCSSWTEAR